MMTGILSNFSRSATESLLTGCITVWYGNCFSHSWKTPQRVVEIPQNINGSNLLSIQDIYHKQCLQKIRTSSRITATWHTLVACRHLWFCFSLPEEQAAGHQLKKVVKLNHEILWVWEESLLKQFQPISGMGGLLEALQKDFQLD